MRPPPGGFFIRLIYIMFDLKVINSVLDQLEEERGIPKEKVIEDLTKSVNDLKASTEQKLASLEAKDRIKMVNDLIEALSEGDKNVKEKMKFFYDNFKGDPADAKETEERVRNAYTLATGGRSARPLTSSMISSAEGIPQINPTGEKMSTELQDLAHRMGVSDQEMKKHKLI